MWTLTAAPGSIRLAGPNYRARHRPQVPHIDGLTRGKPGREAPQPGKIGAILLFA